MAGLFGSDVTISVHRSKIGTFYWVAHEDSTMEVIAIQPMPFCATEEEAAEKAEFVSNCDFNFRGDT